MFICILKNEILCDKIYEMQRETGENPVRARRREAYYDEFSYPVPQTRGRKSLEKSEKAENLYAESKYLCIIKKSQTILRVPVER